MIATDLTSRRVALPDGGTATPYEWGDAVVLVHDDALTVLRLIAALRDEDAPEDERGETVVRSLFADWADAYTACDYDPEEFSRLIASAVWDVCGIDLKGDRAHEEPLWDPEEDAAIIRTSFRMAYGLDWDRAREEISFSEFVALVGGCGTDTPLGRAIYYRNPRTRPRATKHNRKEIEEWERLHRALALGKSRSSRGAAEGTDAAMADAFAALKRAAR